MHIEYILVVNNILSFSQPSAVTSFIRETLMDNSMNDLYLHCAQDRAQNIEKS